MRSLPSTLEAEVVARLARGELQNKIAKDLKINVNTIGHIKTRQAQALQVISGKVTQRKMRITTRLLEKAHRQLEKRLDESENYDQLVEEVWQEYEEGDQNADDKAKRTRKLSRLSQLSVTELLSLTKEMFHQSQVEQGKPTNLIASSGDQQTTKQQLEDLLEAIRNGDEVKMLQMTVTPNDES